MRGDQIAHDVVVAGVGSDHEGSDVAVETHVHIDAIVEGRAQFRTAAVTHCEEKGKVARLRVKPIGIRRSSHWWSNAAIVAAQRPNDDDA